MKGPWFFFVFIVFCCTASAQNTFSNTGSGLNDISRYMDDDSTVADTPEEEEDEAVAATANKRVSSLENVAMEMTDSTVVFDNLPEKGNVSAHLTSAAGDELATKVISTKKPYFSIRRLPEGLYFVTLTYKEKRRAFELKRENEKQKSK